MCDDDVYDGLTNLFFSCCLGPAYTAVRLFSVLEAKLDPPPSLFLSLGCDSLPARRSKRHTAMLVAKWGLVDAVFILSFMPLLYLVKQWSY